jgi:DNA polymerase-3 subunit beta
MLKVTLSIRALRAVLTAVSTEETRYYLNGINLEFTPDGVVMAATDGHRMIVLRQPYGEHGATAAHASVIVPRDLVAKLKINPRMKTLDTTDLTIGDDGRLTFEHAGESFGGSRIDATFPDYRRIVPQDLDGKPAQYNPVYLADFAKARVELGANPTKKGGASPVVKYNGESPAIVDFAYGTSFQAIGVIMPLRVPTTMVATCHTWASAPAQEWPTDATTAAADAAAA